MWVPTFNKKKKKRKKNKIHEGNGPAWDKKRTKFVSLSISLTPTIQRKQLLENFNFWRFVCIVWSYKRKKSEFCPEKGLWNIRNKLNITVLGMKEAEINCIKLVDNITDNNP